MADLDTIYNPRFLELAASIPHSGRLARPDATATAHSKLCGSTVTVEIVLREGRIAEFAQVVRACLLGQAAASAVGRHIVGTTPNEFIQVAAAARAMLKEGGLPPTGRWADIALLEPVRDYKARHASTLLVFDAVERALADAVAAPAAGPATAAAGS